MNRFNSHRIPLIALMLSILALTGCEINQKEVLPEDGFVKIYNHPDEQLAFYPESVIELEGGGYLFLSAVKDETSEIEYPSVWLTRVSARGEVEWSRDHDWLSPAPRLFRSGSRIGFVAMNEEFEAHLVWIDGSSGEITGTDPLEVTMPLVAYQDGQGKLLVLGYDFVSRSSWIARYSTSLAMERFIQLPVNTDLEYLIQRHLNRTGQDFPFFMGEFDNGAEHGYFVNCFYNYTLRTVFLEASSLSATGDIYSFQIEEGISSLIHKSGNRFGLTSYYEGNNYLLPDVEIDVNASQNIKDLPGLPLYELTFKAAVRAMEITDGTDRFALFMSQTNASSIVGYQVEIASDSLVRTHYETFDEHVEVADLIQAADGGVTLLAGIHILGKYRRPLAVKMREEQFFPTE